jgi:hypothetical protein
LGIASARLTSGVWALALSVALCLGWSGSAAAGVYDVAAGSSDAVDANTADAGICDAGGGVCTLRAAVQTANSAGSAGPDTIRLPAGGTFTLTLPGSEDDAVSGDLDLKTTMTIVGLGAGATITGDVAPVDRILDIPSGGPTITLSNLTITKGAAPSGANGGAIKQESGSLTINNSSIGNSKTPSAGTKGGGIYAAATASSLTMTDSNVSGNQAAFADSNGQGAGIYAAAPLTLNRVAIFSNLASFGCAGLCGGYGGGVLAGGGTFTNVTISSNVAGASTTGSGAGGGLVHTGDPLRLINSTVANNQASGSAGLGGGNIDSGQDLRLENTIVANGTTPDKTGTENCANDAGFPDAYVTLGHNLEARVGQAASQCGLNAGVNGDLTSNGTAGLGILAMNGGPTPTHELLFGSPAIDAAGPNGPVTDQRGVSRPQGPLCDIGAFERNSTPMPGFTCAGPPAPPSGGPTGAGTTPASAAKKCKKKKKKARVARKKCKKKRR